MLPNVLVSARLLRRHLGEPSWAVFDCRFDLERPAWGERSYLEQHIPGAVYAHLERDLCAKPDGHNGRHPLPDNATLVALFSRLGISAKTQVIAYDTSGGPYAARLWWTLRYIGHDRAAVLDGGLAAWREMGYAERGGREIRPEAEFVPHPHPEMIAQGEEIRRSLDTPGIFLLDARSAERFWGEAEPYDPVAGRIPGATNRFWKENLDSRGHFRPAEELRKDFKGLLGQVPASRIVSYCGSGVTAAQNLLALAHARLDGGRMYPGSWSEWCAQPENPIACGKGGWTVVSPTRRARALTLQSPEHRLLPTVLCRAGDAAGRWPHYT
jgi:thiosulfate/3-mercaptopyruvate sulfurtransferase